jgi:hypothetical protein
MKIVYENLIQNINSDMQLLCLLKYASRVKHVTVMGAKSGLSLLTVIAAGADTITLWDPEKQNTQDFEKICAENNQDFTHSYGEITDNIQQTDLLYLDSFAEAHLKFSELSRYQSQVSRYIIIPNTYTHAHDAQPGFVLPNNLQPAGVIHGINSFIAQFPQWHILEHLYWAPGMTVLYNRKDVSDNGR